MHKDANISKPCHVGIHWIVLAEYSQISTHMPGSQSFLRSFASFSIGRISHPQHYRIKTEAVPPILSIQQQILKITTFFVKK